MFPEQTTDERNLDAVERLIAIAEAAGLSLTHMGLAFVIAHPGVTSAILGPRTMQQLDDPLAGAVRSLNAPPLRFANASNSKGLARTPVLP